MYGSYESDEFASLLGGFESDESDESDEFFLRESDEAAPRRGPRPRLPTAKRGSPVPRRAGPGYATKDELQATANRLDARIGTNSKAIQALDTRTRSLETETARLSSAVKKELNERKTSTEALKKDLDQMRNNSILLALLSQPTTTDIGPVHNVVVDNSGPMGHMLPLLLMAGGGSSGGGLFGGSNDGGMGNLIPLLIIMQAMNQQPQRP